MVMSAKTNVLDDRGGKDGSRTFEVSFGSLIRRLIGLREQFDMAWRMRGYLDSGLPVREASKRVFGK
jgi:hypothetical protein